LHLSPFAIFAVSPFFDIMGPWFFDIDMLSCLASQNGRRRVPVVGSGYDDSLNFEFVENFPKVADNFGGFMAGFDEF
jgi:hypothetical protein